MSLDNLIRKENSMDRRRFLRHLGALSAISLLPSCAARYTIPERPINTMYHTIIHEMLDMELEFGAIAGDYLKLDLILNDAISAAGVIKRKGDSLSREEGLRLLNALDSLFRKENFDTQQNELLHDALELDRLDCDGYTVFYVAAGQLLNLEIDFVRAPNHAFARLEIEEGYINWETTSGKEKTDDEMIEMHNIPENSVGRSFMKSLDVYWHKEEILATHYANLGVHAVRKDDNKLARLLFEEAVRGDRNYDFAHYNLGIVQQADGDDQKAIDSFTRAIELNRNHAKPYALIGRILHNHGKIHEAIRWYSKSLDRDPGYLKALSNMELAYNELGDKRSSCEIKLRMIEADPSYFIKHPEDKPSTLCEM